MTEPGLEPTTSWLEKPALLSTRLNTIIRVDFFGSLCRFSPHSTTTTGVTCKMINGRLRGGGSVGGRVKARVKVDVIEELKFL